MCTNAGHARGDRLSSCTVTSKGPGAGVTGGALCRCPSGDDGAAGQGQICQVAAKDPDSDRKGWAPPFPACRSASLLHACLPEHHDPDESQQGWRHMVQQAACVRWLGMDIQRRRRGPGRGGGVEDN